MIDTQLLLKRDYTSKSHKSFINSSSLPFTQSFPSYPPILSTSTSFSSLPVFFPLPLTLSPSLAPVDQRQSRCTDALLSELSLTYQSVRLNSFYIEFTPLKSYQVKTRLRSKIVFLLIVALKLQFDSCDKYFNVSKLQLIL